MSEFVVSAVELQTEKKDKDKSPPYLAKFPATITISQSLNQIPTATIQYPITPDQKILFNVRDGVRIGVAMTGVPQNSLDVVFSGQITEVGYTATPAFHTQTFVVKGYSDILRKLYAVQLRAGDLSENAYGFAEIQSFIGDGTGLSLSPTAVNSGVIAFGSNLIESWILKNAKTADPIDAIIKLINELAKNSPLNESIQKNLTSRLSGLARKP